MEHLRKQLQWLYAKGNKFSSVLSQRWQQHANRRTTLFLIVVAIIITLLFVGFIEPPGSFPIGKLVTVPEGASLSEIGETLEAQGVVRSARAFDVVEYITGHERDVHAGDYLFKEPQNVFAIARAIAIGAYGLEPMRIRIQEGATTKEMAAIFKAKLERFDPDRFLEKAQPMEGFLFPDTYFFLPNASDDLVFRTMRQNFDTRIASVTPEISAFGQPLKDIVTMASILEREARDPTDRRKIAGVLWNRINKGMRLQVDATFLYTIGKGTFDLTTEDLKSDSPYNTYMNKGLPPTPIGSPSLDSLMAAVTPEKSDYYYYLADSHGVTHYSKTYPEHLRQKALYIGN